MTTYKTRDGGEYPRYEKFTIKWIATLFWIPLLVGENRVRYFESSQLVEVKSPFDSGLIYCYPAIPQNFDSGLLYDQPAEAPRESITYLNHPVTMQPCRFVAYENSMICLVVGYVSRKVGWFSLAEMEAANPTTNVLAAFDSGLLYTVPLPPGFVLEVEMPADLRGAISYTKGVKLVQPTLWAEGLKVA